MKKEIIVCLLSGKQFPIAFKKACSWMDLDVNEEKSLLLKRFQEGRDFSWKRCRTSIHGSSRRNLYLTVNCFNLWARDSGTRKGMEVYQLLVDCETKLKLLLVQDLGSRKHKVAEVVVKDSVSRKRKKVVAAVIQNKPRLWSKRFSEDFFDEFYRITGWKRPKKGHPPCMGALINKFVYEYFPEGVLAYLRELNPRGSNGYRRQKHHQYLTVELGIQILVLHQAQLLAVMRLSPSGDLKRFQRNMNKVFSKAVQLEIPGLED